MTYSNNQDNQSKVNHKDASASEDNIADLFNEDKLSYQELEGLTDTDELKKTVDKEVASQKTENASPEQATKPQQTVSKDDEGSHGNENIRKAVENLDRNEMKHNLKDESAGTDEPSPNPAPFITPE